MTTKDKTFYKVTFRDLSENKVIVLRVRSVMDSHLGLGFVCLSDFIFEDRGRGLLLLPTEENWKKKFQNTKALHISLYTILSIEEVGSENKGLEFKKDRSNIIMLGDSESGPWTPGPLKPGDKS